MRLVRHALWLLGVPMSKVPTKSAAGQLGARSRWGDKPRPETSVIRVETAALASIPPGADRVSWVSAAIRAHAKS